MTKEEKMQRLMAIMDEAHELVQNENTSLFAIIATDDNIKMVCKSPTFTLAEMLTVCAKRDKNINTAIQLANCAT